MNHNAKQPTIDRDGEALSLWQTGNIDLPLVKTMADENTVYDTLIIGGGITGITTALLLQQAGQKCIIAEAHTLGFGSTSGTSAHLNTFFDATYNEIEKDFGEDAAKLVATSGKEALALIAQLAEEYQIACDLEYKSAYLYSENKEESKQLREILESSKKAGVAAETTNTNGINVPFHSSILFKDQGQFHPLKYILGLSSAFIAAGGIILENTFIREVSFEEELHLASADDTRIRARNVVYATHIPPGISQFNFRCAAYRSYVLGIRLSDNNYPRELVYDMQEPYHYSRTHVIDGQEYLILGGEDHKTGHEDPEQAFKNLEDYARQYYAVASVDFKWSSQYYIPVDGLPYIGLSPGVDDRTYIATGFNGNGMIFGTLSAKILSDLILGRDNPYARLFSPSRMKPVAGFMDFIKENADVAYHFITDRFSAEDIDSLDELEPDSGRIVEYKNHRLAVYKDPEGKVWTLNPICTHAGCVVNFNAVEKSWDCPCHGGRFDCKGKVLTGPPRENLQQIIPD